MKYYLISLNDGAENLSDKYKIVAKTEECLYTRWTPTEYIDEPPEDWYKDSREKLENAVEISKKEVKGREWTEIKYPGVRYYIDSGDMRLDELVKLSGGQVNIYGRGMPNSTKFFEEEECSAFFGFPDIGHAMVLEFVDDGLENFLVDFSAKNTYN